MGGVCQFPQGAALFPIWCLLFIAIAMGIVCVCVEGGGGGGGLVGPCLPLHFFGGKFNNFFKKMSFCREGYLRTLLQEWPWDPLHFSRPPANCCALSLSILFPLV